MKKKSMIAIVSVALNVVLFSGLAYYNKLNNHAESGPALVFVVHHLDDNISEIQSAHPAVALAAAVK